MGTDDANLVRSLFTGLARDNVRAFIGAVAADRQMYRELSAVGLRPDAVATFARSRGFVFSAAELEAFFDDCLAAGLTPSELEQRRRFLDRRAAGLVPGPQPMDAVTEPVLQRRGFDAGFVLDRRRILEGNIVVLCGWPALQALLDHVREVIAQCFGVDDLVDVHRRLDEAAFHTRLDAAYAALRRDRGVVGLVTAFVRSLGLDPDRLLFEWPAFRVVRPERAAAVPGRIETLPPHRDTWYGRPRHVINLWAPVCPLPPEATLRVLPRYFRKSVDNSSEGYDVWCDRLGLSIHPQARGDVDTTRPTAPPLDVGDAMIFAAHQLHASAVNTGDRTRVSFELRFMHRDDEDAPYVPPNIDNHGIGERERGWFDHDGRPVVHLPRGDET